MLNWFRLHPYALPVLVLAAGLAATAFIILQLSRLIDAQDATRFERQSSESINAIEQRVRTFIAVLDSGAGLFAVVPNVTQEQFRLYVRQLWIGERYPGIQGIGWSARLRPQDKAAFEQQQSAWFPDFHVWPDQDREEYHAITYLEPLDRRNRAAIGYDMFTESTRRSAMAHARDSGDAALSGLVELVQEIDQRKQPGFLIYVPYYAGGRTPETIEERRRLLAGFIFSPFRARDLFQGIFRDTPRPSLRVAIYDGAPVATALLHDTGARPLRAASTPRFEDVTTLELGGRTWVIRVSTEPDFDRGSGLALLPLAGLLGGLTSLICTLIAWDQARARVAEQREIQERERAERQRSILIDELNHRVKNTLATVQSIARQTLKSSTDTRSFSRALEGRLMALAKAHELLTATNWEGTTLRQLIDAELAPYNCLETGRCSSEGPHVALSPRTALSLGMALHELITNAAKHGALSVADGRVAIAWRLDDAADGRRLAVSWRESGGPRVKWPKKRGFGSALLEQGIAFELQGSVKLDFAPDGVTCDIDIPLPGEAPPARSYAEA